MTMNWTEGFDPLEVFRVGETLFRAGRAEEARAEFRRFLSFYRCASSPPADAPVPDEAGLMPATFWMPLDSVIGPVLVVSRLLPREAEKCRAAALLLQTLTPAGANLPPDTPEHCDRLWAALTSDTSALAGTLPEALPATRAAAAATVLDRLVRHSPAVAGDDALLVLLARALREVPLHDVAAGIEGHLTARIFQLSGLFPASVRHDPRSFAGAMFALDWLRRWIKARRKPLPRRITRSFRTQTRTPTGHGTSGSNSIPRCPDGKVSIRQLRAGLLRSAPTPFASSNAYGGAIPSVPGSHLMRSFRCMFSPWQEIFGQEPSRKPG